MANFLFVHQNFPGQFLHIVQALANAGHNVVGIGKADRIKRASHLHPKIRLFGYPEPKTLDSNTHHYVRNFESHVRRGQAVYRTACRLKSKGFTPDVIMAHPGWGEALFLRDAFANAHHIHYLEFFYHADGADVGFDPEFPVTEDDRCRLRVKNATQMLSFNAANEGISPTAWQKSLYPAEWQHRITQMHDGIEALATMPHNNIAPTLSVASFDRDGNSTNTLVLTSDDEVITYAARNLEPYRGFHTFMRAIPEILERRPKAHIVIVGGDGVSYGRNPTKGISYREQYRREWQDDVDYSRVHFVGHLPYSEYLKVLQVSSLHIYLTYPFVLSWSLLEAMSARCVISASDTSPVQEVIQDNKNGYLFNFFDSKKLNQRACEILEENAIPKEISLPERFKKSYCIPRITEILTRSIHAHISPARRYS